MRLSARLRHVPQIAMATMVPRLMTAVLYSIVMKSSSMLVWSDPNVRSSDASLVADEANVMIYGARVMKDLSSIDSRDGMNR